MSTDGPTQPPDDSTAPLGGARGAPVGGAVGRFRVDGMLGRGGMGIVLDAYDPELARPVAVKLLRPDVWGDAAGVDRARLQREAQAMAKLSHPNVVTVYEVGEVDGQAFLAMEKIDGETLRVWQERAREPAAVIAMYVAVGRGLAAAHAAELVHRDFKPENVLVGRDGRARVGDFGLVAGGFAIGSGDAGDAPVGAHLTVRGSAMGTPAYMAPEQWAGETIDARTDQFAFAVALWEAIYGERPFAGRDVASIRASVLAGTRRAPPRAARAPSWLFPILVRALERDPARRWPTLAAMLDELERRATPARVPMVAVGGIAALASVAVVIALVTRPHVAAADPCADPTARLAGIWDDAAQAKLRAHLERVDPAGGAARFAAIARFAERHLNAWSRASIDSCRANRSGLESDTLRDARVTCLDARLAEVDRTAAATLASGDAVALDRVSVAWTELTPVADCADDASIMAYTPPPVAIRSEAAQLERELAELAIARRAGQLEGLQGRVAAALATARTLAHPPLLAAALAEVARVAEARTDWPAQEAALYELVEVAARGKDDVRGAEAWSWLVSVTAAGLALPDKALSLLPAARAAMLRAGDRLAHVARGAIGEAQAYRRLQRYPEAIERLEPILVQLEAAGAADPQSPLFRELIDAHVELGIVRSRAKSGEAALEDVDAAMALVEAGFGPDHPYLAAPLIVRGAALQGLDRKDEARRAHEEAVRIRELRLGPSPALASALGALGGVLVQSRQETAALPVLERAAQMARDTMPDGNPEKLITLSTLGGAYARQQRDAEARALYDEAIALGDSANVRVVVRASALVNRGDLDVRAGDCTAAIERFERAVRQFGELGDRDHPGVVQALRRIGMCRIELRDWDAALGAFDRAAAVKQGPNLAIDAMLIDHLRGHVLIASGRDVVAGRALQAKALAAAKAHPDVVAAIAQLKYVQNRIAPGVPLE